MTDVLERKGDARDPDLRTQEVVVISSQLLVGKVVPPARFHQHQAP